MPRPAPRITIVCAVTGTSAHLSDLIGSLAQQTFDPAPDQRGVEVIAVDAGASPENAALLRAWATEKPDVVTLIDAGTDGPRTLHAGLNLGLAHARGEWVTFPHSDDVLANRYLNAVDEFLDRHPDADLLATNRVVIENADASAERQHTLYRMFRSNQLVDLAASPTHFHPSAAAAFFRRTVLVEQGLGFDETLGETFAETHLIGRYLLGLGTSRVGFVARARYLQRIRSTPYGATDPGAPTHAYLFEHGYGDLVTRSRERSGTVPGWLQRTLGFDLARLLDASKSAGSSFLDPDEDPATFHGRIGDLIADADLTGQIRVAEYYLARETRLALLHSYLPGDPRWVDDHVLIDKVDTIKGQVRARYYFAGERPAERILIGGIERNPSHAKVRTVTYQGRTLLRERIMWLRFTPDLALELDGVAAHLCFERPAPPATTIAPSTVEWHLGPEPKRITAAIEHQAGPAPTSRAGVRALRTMDSKKVRREFAGAWALMDKVHDGGDNAEHLFVYLRANHPEINAYFVVQKDTSTWKRLEASGHGSRLVEHGSHRWRMLMANCTEYLSSHWDATTIEPPLILEFTRPRWRFTMLDHGVRKDDMSHLFAGKQVDLVLTSTPDEYDSIAGDENGYALTTKEVRACGMPRLDRLLRVGARVPVDQRRLLVVAPTWRDWLVPAAGRGLHLRDLDPESLTSEFVQRWRALLVDPRLVALCDEHDLDLTLLPHPHIEPMIERLDLPAYVGIRTYASTDVQELFARTRLLVTDYSSIAFDLAYIDRQVEYFQFDQATFFGGAHSTRPGYYRYAEDGFGPVSTDLDTLLSSIGATLSSGPGPRAPYDARIAATFPKRDGRCCNRVVNAVLTSAQPNKPAEREVHPVHA